MKKKRFFLIVMVVLVVGAYTMYEYLYRDHRNIETEVAVLTTPSERLQQMFAEDQAKEILNQTVVVSGTITQIEGTSVTLDDKVQCDFDGSINEVSVGDKVMIKGRCIGYDDLFELVKIDQSTLTQPE